MPPSGNTTEAAKAYYDWLFAQYIGQIPADRTQILWSGPFWIALWAFVLIGFFFIYALYLQRVRRQQGEMYGAASFAGSLMERIGKVSTFTWVFSITIIIWALYFIVTHSLSGQVY